MKIIFLRCSLILGALSVSLKIKKKTIPVHFLTWVVLCQRDPTLQSNPRNLYIFGENVVFDGLKEYAKPFSWNQKIVRVTAKNRYLTKFNFRRPKISFDAISSVWHDRFPW